MSKRNFILLIVTLLVAVFTFYAFLYFRSDPNTPITDLPGINFLSQFNPFASNPGTPDTGTPVGDLNGDGILSENEMLTIKLKKVSTMPIAGFTVFNKERLKEVPILEPTPQPQEVGEENVTTPSAKPPAPVVENKKTFKTNPDAPITEMATALRYVEKATGNIYQTFADKISERKFSSTLIPKVYDAYFTNRGQSVIMRHLKQNNRTIETFSGSLPKEKIGEDIAANELNGVFLTDDIKDISLSPDTVKAFYLLDSKGTSIGTILNSIDNKKSQIFSSPFTEWNSSWATNKFITLTTKPSGVVPGYMYTLDTGNKNLTKVLGGLSGLTTQMSPDGKYVLVSDNTLSLYLYDIGSKTYIRLGVNTLPEKCVWNKTSETVYCSVPVNIDQALYPDDWYKGEVSFSDQIWKIDTNTGSTTLLVDPLLTQNGEDIDGVKLAVDDNENYLFFVNKKDSFLWELELK